MQQKVYAQNILNTSNKKLETKKLLNRREHKFAFLENQNFRCYTSDEENKLQMP